MRLGRAGTAVGAALLLAGLAVLPSAAHARGREQHAASGGLIAFVRDPDSGVGNFEGAVFTARPDGSDLEQLTEPDPLLAGPDEVYPAWSPDGKRLAFSCREQQSTCHFTLLAKGVASEVIGLPPSAAAQLGPIDGDIWCGGQPAPEQNGVAVSPRGNEVALGYASEVDVSAFAPAGPDDSDFFYCGAKYKPVGNEVRVTLPDGILAYAYSWSPDGTKIAIQGTDGLYVGSAGGGAARRIFATPYNLYPGTPTVPYTPPRVKPAWSPDGARLAFVEPGGPYYDAEGGIDPDNETDVWTIGVDGSKPQIAIRNATDPSWQPSAASFETCSIEPPAVSQFPLDYEEQVMVEQDQTALAQRYSAALQRSIAALAKDEQTHPSHARADQATIGQLERLLGGARSLEAAAAPPSAKVTEAERQLVRDAACGLMDSAVSSLKSFIDDTDTVEKKAEAKQLVDKVDQFGQVLSGKIKPESGEATQLLKTNVADLVQHFAGGDSGKYVSQSGDLLGKAAELYHVLQGSLTEEQLTQVQNKNIVALATKIGGKEAGELANQLLTFRNMLSGRATEDEQFVALRTAFVDLATRFVGSNIMKTPQARAAMLGFQIGTALGNSIAANLKLIQKIALVRACGTALYSAQQKAGVAASSYLDLDYGVKTKAEVTKAISVAFDDSTCTIVPEGKRAGVKGGVVEVLLPTYFLGVGWKNGYVTVYYDPDYTAQG